MRAKLFAAAIALGSTAFAQTGPAEFAAGLRSKFGPPLLRETFTVMPGVEMVVDYAANGNVCRIELPPRAPEPDRSGVRSGRAMDEFLKELIPLALRGKELGSLMSATGTNSLTTVVTYENLAIARSSARVTVTFPKEQCRDRSE
jgi:hypothetical protein